MLVHKKVNIVLVVAAFFSSVALSNDAPSKKQKKSMVEEVIVSATRRSESVQDVGIAISAFSGEQLEEMNVSSAGELAQLTPNVEFKKQWGSRGNSSLFYVRGVGQADFNEGSESPTTVYVDDFYIMSNSATDFLMHDVDGAEVLRGPQGALFGRNSTAGAVIVRNHQPTRVFEGHMAAAAGNHHLREIKGMINLPLIEEKLAIRFSGESERYDATTNNLYVGPGPGGLDTHEGDFQSLRSIIKWDLSDKLSISYKYQYGFVDARNGGDSSRPMLVSTDDTIITPQDGYGYAPFQSGADSTTVISEGVNDFQNDVDHHLITIEYDLDDNISLKSITGYLEQSKYTLEDCDGTPRTICHAYNTVDQDYWTQELRLSADWDNARFTLGGFYLSQDYKNIWVLPLASGTGTSQGNASIQPGDTAGGLVQITPNTADLDSYALYSNVAYDVSEKITLTAGIRWNHEERYFQQTEGLYAHDHPDTGLVTFQGNTFGILALDRDGYTNFLANNVLGSADPVGDPEVNFQDVFEDDYITYELTLNYQPNEAALLVSVRPTTPNN